MKRKNVNRHHFSIKHILFVLLLGLVFCTLSCRHYMLKGVVEDQVDQFFTTSSTLFTDKIESDETLATKTQATFHQDILALEKEFPSLSKAYDLDNYTFRFISNHNPTESLTLAMDRLGKLFDDGIDLDPYELPEFQEEINRLTDINKEIETNSDIQFTEAEKEALQEDIINVSIEKEEALTGNEILEYCLLPENKSKYPKLHKQWDKVYALALERAELEANIEAEGAKRYFMMLNDLLVDKDRFLDNWKLFKTDPSGAIQQMEPTVTHYANLKKALKKYREYAKKPYDDYNFKAGWKYKVKEGTKNGTLVLRIKKRLAAEGYWTGDMSETWDAALTAALTRYQENHQVVPDGVFGRGTAESFNIPLDRRVNQIRLAMKRLRESKGRWDDVYVRINVPQMALEVRKDQKVLRTHKIVVGKRSAKNNTPRFSDEIELIIFNPKWFVPQRIIKEEMQPAYDKDEEYFKKKGYVAKINEEGKVLAVTQPSGGRNALGVVKILFPNPHDVYLHDTPTKYLFKRTIRAFSHGCMRTHNATDFAKFLLELDNNEELANVDEYLKKRRRKEVFLNKKIPVHIEYVIASSNEQGDVVFFGDIYSQEKEILAVMDSKEKETKKAS